ncbi:MAG TPA: DUF3310 domain-containing protein [Gemmataceae bacterium]|nr:DUF3310 domain-containing protein [Gemmataceae bacterium]
MKTHSGQQECLAQPPTPNDSVSALDRQIGGDHYRTMAIQPVEFIVKNGIGFCEGNAITYLCRWRSKDGIKDLRKAIHHIELLIELEEAKDVLGL